MDVSRWSDALRTTRAGSVTDDAAIRDAAWVARCVGRGAAAPLAGDDIAALAETLHPIRLRASQPLFGANAPGSTGVWIVRSGQVELSVVSGRSRVVVGVLRPGDVEGDIPLLLGLPLPYAARAVDDVTCLRLTSSDFEELLARHPAIARRWLSSVAQRLATSHERLIALLGHPLPAQLAGLLLDEAQDDGSGPVVRLPQRTLAAMLGVARPSLNKILKDFERQDHIEVGYAAVRVLDPAALEHIRRR